MWTSLKVIQLDGQQRELESKVDALREVENGSLLIARNVLQSSGVFAPLLEELHRVARETTGNPKSAIDSPEKFHEAIAPGNVENIYLEYRKYLKTRMPFFTKRLFESLGATDPFYIHDASLVRIMTPYAVQKKYAQAYGYHLGKLSLHGPHHDLYQSVPINAINTWVALGRVDRENSMLIFPDAWKSYLPKGDGFVAADQELGRPIEFELEAGDALIFHSNHMHSSRLNTSDETRIVFTNRVCLDAPVYPSKSTRHPYIPASFFPPNLSLPEAFETPEAIGQPAYYGEQGEDIQFADLPMTPKTVSAEKLMPKRAEDVQTVNEIFLVDDATCGVRTEAGDVLKFSRYCPHQGADLLLGFMDDGKVFCPHHGAKFCPRTGEPNCDALRPIRVG